METLLKIDASMRLTGSYTRTITDYFERAWLEKKAQSKVIRRCLVNNPIPHLTDEVLESFSCDAEADLLSETLIAELQQADHVVIGTPLYNLSLPSTLKAYFDYVVRSGVTFSAGEQGYRGLLTGKSATLITARASPFDAKVDDDFQTDYLKSILAFVGITDVEVIAIDGTADGENRQDLLKMAQCQVDLLLEQADDFEWPVGIDDRDKQAILRLRGGQANAIVAGDWQAYAALCLDDIQLLLPSQPLVVGLAAFKALEREMFSLWEFSSFQKHPQRITQVGEGLAETGYQQVVMHRRDEPDTEILSRQKYLHLYQKTCDGWRFAALMSNHCE